LLERKERLQLEKCSGAQKPVACCSDEGWGFYGRFNSGLGGFFSLAMDLQAFSGELVWFAPLLGDRKQSWEHFAHQPCGRSIRPCIFSLGCWNAVYNSLSGSRDAGLYLPLRVQECRLLTPQDAGMTVFSGEGWGKKGGDGLLIHLP
jgi:hypothetical protein